MKFLKNCYAILGNEQLVLTSVTHRFGGTFWKRCELQTKISKDKENKTLTKIAQSCGKLQRERMKDIKVWLHDSEEETGTP